MNSKMAVIGDADSVMLFMAIGAKVCYASDAEQAKKALLQLVREQYDMILITEKLAIQVENTIDRFKKQAFPAIVLIPDTQGSLDVGFDAIGKNVEKALGSQLLFDKER